MTSTAHAQAQGLTPLLATDLQDHLVSVTHDLERLHTLLADACHVLMTSFHGAHDQVGSLRAGSPDLGSLDRASVHLAQAVTALQFEDLAAQLLQHSRQRLRHCVDRLASAALGDEDDPGLLEDEPLRPNPVTQDEVDAGSIELF